MFSELLKACERDFGRSGQEQAMCCFSHCFTLYTPCKTVSWRRDSGKNGTMWALGKEQGAWGSGGRLAFSWVPLLRFELYTILCVWPTQKLKYNSCSHLLTTMFGVSVGLWHQTPVWFLTLSSCVNLSKFLSSSKPLFPYCDTNIMITMLEIKLEIEKAVPGSGNWLWTETMPRDTRIRQAHSVTTMEQETNKITS